MRPETHGLYYDILAAFYRRTGCPVIVNTSFNVRGEPIVCTPEDAYRCFMRTNIDVLVLENFVLEKSAQPKRAEDESWKTEFVLDWSTPISDATRPSDTPVRSRPRYWELLMNLTRREVKGRYSQSLFGAGWAIAQPLATMAVFTLVFARLGQIPSGGAPYPLFAYAALVPWFFFSNSVNSGTMSLITYRNIVTKTYFPREIVPLAQVARGWSILPRPPRSTSLLMIYYGVGLGRGALLLPVVLRAAAAVHAGRDACDVGGERLLSRRQSGRADWPAALAVSDARGLSAVGGSRALSLALSAQPADRHRRGPPRHPRVRPRAGLGRRRRLGRVDLGGVRRRRSCSSSGPTSTSPTSSNRSHAASTDTSQFKTRF